MRKPSRWTLVGLTAFIVPVVVLLALNSAPAGQTRKGAPFKRVMLAALGQASSTKAYDVRPLSPGQGPTTSSGLIGAPVPGPAPSSTLTTSSGPAGAHVVVVPAAPKAPTVVLYDQYNNAGANATLSATFTDFPTFSSDLADDFVVPAGPSWNVTSVDADGVYFNGAGPATSFNVFIYSNSGTLPGAAVFSATNQSFTQVGSTFTVNLAPAAVLPAGTYWVEMQANMTFGTQGEWGWTDRTVQSNSPAAWQNPGGGFGVCPTWAGKLATCVPTASGPDQVYRLNGTIGGGATPTPTPTPAGIIYDQYNNAGANATLSATFTDFPTFSADLADDFVVPAGQTWTVTAVDADGVYFNGPGPATSFNVFIYSNSGTLPGATAFSATNQPFTQGGTTFTVNLAPAAVLPPGTYWVEMQANMTFGTQGEWGWTDRTVQSNSPAAWQNPGGGFGVCPTWAPKLATCVPTASGPDQVFRLHGTIGGAATATPTPSPTPIPPTPSCTAVVTGSIDNSDPTQVDRLFRSGIPQTCPASTSCAIFGDGTPRHYDSYTFVNTTGSTQCVTVNLNTACTGNNFIFGAAYLGSFDPNNICTNWIADSGFSPNPDQAFSFNLANGQTVVVVVNEVNPGAGCPAYTVTLTGVCSGPTPTPTPTTPPPTNTPTNTPPPGSLTALSPAKLWVGLKNSDDVGTRLDLLAEVFLDATKIGQGEVDNVASGSSGFNNAILQTIALSCTGCPAPAPAGTQLKIRVSARRTCTGGGHLSGTPRLWYNGQPIDAGATRDAGSRFDATIGGSTDDYFLRTGFTLEKTPGAAKASVDVFVNSAAACPARPFVSWGTWVRTLP